MAKIKLTKTAVETAQPQAQAIELRDTLLPGFLCKITPAGRKVFMLQYRTNAGERRKPALGLFGELTVEQARSPAQEWLAQVRRGGDPAADKAAARKALTVAELCMKFMEDHSKQRNKPSTQDGYGATKFAVGGITEALAQEVGPLGIHVTVVEPGLFRTDFLDQQSMVKTATEIADYEDSAGATRRFAETANHAQPGDPAKLVNAIVALVYLPEPPLRLPLVATRSNASKPRTTSSTTSWQPGSVCPYPLIL